MKFLKVLKVLFDNDTWIAIVPFIMLIRRLIVTHHDTIAIILAIMFLIAVIMKCFDAIEKSKKEIKKMTIRCPECRHEMQTEEFAEDVIINCCQCNAKLRVKGNPGFFKRTADFLAGAMNVVPLTNFTFRHFFSQTFKWHSNNEVGEFFPAGQR